MVELNIRTLELLNAVSFCSPLYSNLPPPSQLPQFKDADAQFLKSNQVSLDLFLKRKFGKFVQWCNKDFHEIN